MIKSIQVYGRGCANCQRLYKLAEEVVSELGSDIQIVKVENLNEMLAAGVMHTPALAFDGKLVMQGKIPTAATLKNWILTYQENK
jgi:small redox-active disulfide protein 2